MEVFKNLEDFRKKNSFYNIYISILLFSKDTEWLTQNEPLITIAPIKIVSKEDEHLDTNIGKAFRELNRSLKDKTLSIRNATEGNEKFFLPIVILISDGLPTDDYEKDLEIFLNSMEGRRSVIIPILVGKQRKHTIFSSFAPLNKDGKILRVDQGPILSDTIIDKIRNIKAYPDIGSELELHGLEMKIKVIKEIGSGGQGKVFLAKTKEDDQDFALKWYNPNSSTLLQKVSIANLIYEGSPDKRFVWPLDIAEKENILGFGYIMELKEDRFLDLSVILSQSQLPRYGILLRACYEFANAFQAVHSKGQSYQDISLKNLFMDPLTGEIRIIDSDNIVFENNRSTIKGTKPFMAPEILKGTSRPNIQSDRFALWILIFYIYYYKYSKESILAEKHINRKEDFLLPIGTGTIGDFDTEAQDDYHNLEQFSKEIILTERFPKDITDLIDSAFISDGDKPTKRVIESNWMKAISKIQGLVYQCDECKTENFLRNAENISELKETDFMCWVDNYSSHKTRPYWIDFKGHSNIIILDESSIVYNYQLPFFDGQEMPKSYCNM